MQQAWMENVWIWGRREKIRKIIMNAIQETQAHLEYGITERKIISQLHIVELLLEQTQHSLGTQQEFQL